MDVPSIDTVPMLRPTKRPVIWRRRPFFPRRSPTLFVALQSRPQLGLRRRIVAGFPFERHKNTGEARRGTAANRDQADTLRGTGALMWRGVLLGTALNLLLGGDREVNLRLTGVTYIVAVVWSYYDGMFARRVWSMAIVEAIFLHLPGIQVGNPRAVIFGYPPLGT